nr:MAG TPA: hypothetical protein [Caudoviricetes sp.]
MPTYRPTVLQHRNISKQINYITLCMIDIYITYIV